MIAGMASELLAIDSLGQLRGWAWSEMAPPMKIHPRSDSLNITGERVRTFYCLDREAVG